MKLIVDRIEGNFAVCEKEDKTMVDIPLADLPEDLREGSILVSDNGTYTIDKAAMSDRKAKLAALRNSIFNK